MNLLASRSEPPASRSNAARRRSPTRRIHARGRTAPGAARRGHATGGDRVPNARRPRPGDRRDRPGADPGARRARHPRDRTDLPGDGGLRPAGRDGDGAARRQCRLERRGVRPPRGRGLEPGPRARRPPDVGTRRAAPAPVRPDGDRDHLAAARLLARRPDDDRVPGGEQRIARRRHRRDAADGRGDARRVGRGRDASAAVRGDARSRARRRARPAWLSTGRSSSA